MKHLCASHKYQVQRSGDFYTRDGRVWTSSYVFFKKANYSLWKSISRFDKQFVQDSRVQVQVIFCPRDATVYEWGSYEYFSYVHKLLRHSHFHVNLIINVSRPWQNFLLLVTNFHQKLKYSAYVQFMIFHHRSKNGIKCNFLETQNKLFQKFHSKFSKSIVKIFESVETIFSLRILVWFPPFGFRAGISFQ